METVQELAQDFLAQKTIAITGVSRTKPSPANGIYERFKNAGYQVYAVNPAADTFENDPCFASLKDLPTKVDGVVIVNRPEVTRQIVEDAIELGIPRVWMHGMGGTLPGAAASATSVSVDAVARCRESGLSVIPGACPMMFLNPDVFHRCARGLLKMTGKLKIVQ